MIVARFRGRSLISDVPFVATTFQRLQPFLNARQIPGAERLRVGDDSADPFDVLESGQSIIGKIQLRIIENVTDHHFMAIMAEMLQSVQKCFRVINEIGNQNHHSPPFDPLGHFMKHLADVGISGCRLRFQKIQNPATKNLTSEAMNRIMP